MSFLLTLAQATTAATTAASQPATQQAAQKAVEQPGTFDWVNQGFLGFLVQSGWFVIPLLLCSIFALAVIIERYRAYKAISIDVSGFRAQIKALLAQNKIDDAVALADSTPGPISATVAVGLRRFKLLQLIGRPADQVEADIAKTIDDYGVHIIAILEKHLPILASIAALAPLFGFAGTIQGMIGAFNEIAANAGAGNIIQMTAAGIREALFTTIEGLMIGIPALLFYNHFTARVNAIVLEVEETANELIQNLALMTAVGAHALETKAPPAPLEKQPA